MKHTMASILRSAPRRIPSSKVISSRLPARRHGSTIPPRTSAFTAPTIDHVKHLRSLLSSSGSLISTLDQSASPEDLTPFNDDWLNKYHGKGQVVVKPKTTEEVSQVMKYCYENGIPIVPQGGNTGLVGGSTPIHDELVLSLSNLSSIRSFDPVSGILVCDAGVILETADGYLADKGFIFPLDLGAKGSCHVGGNVATNAGGLRLLRYGSLHGSVLGLEVVLPDGTVWNGLSKLRKDNTGFDLKQLFIGSEGSIGIITAISILCPRRPTAQNVAVFSLSSYEEVQKVFGEAKKYLGEILSAFEFWDKQSYALVRKHDQHNGNDKKVFEEEGDFYCLIETGGSNAEHDEAKLSALVKHLLESGLVHDGVLAQDTTQFASLWALRETIGPAASQAGSVYKYDVSVPVGKMYGLRESLKEKLNAAGLLGPNGDAVNDKGFYEGGKVMAIGGYGHMGDGNLHINVVADSYDEEIEKVIEPYIYEAVSENEGSISAEHGLGVMKAPYVGYSNSVTSIDLMRKVKHLFDPKGLLNPYKYIT